jgi:CelD/BcsL family acetyltransferase involved in cellulose biosynthesis
VGDRVELIEGIESLAAGWDALADATSAGPFVRPGWFAAWFDAFGGGGRPVVLCVRRGRRLAGALCLARQGGGALRSPTNWHTPAYGTVAEDAAAAGTLARAALARAPSVVDVAFVDAGDAFAAQLVDGARARRRPVITRPVQNSPYIPLDGDFKAFEASLAPKFKREARRRRRKLAEEGEVTVGFSDGRDALERLLDEGFAVEGSGWKTELGTAIAQDDATDRFYRRVAAWAADRGWLQLGFVRVSGRAIAFSYSIVCGGTVHVVKVGFEPGFRQYAPGTILTREAIARAYGQGQRRFDFLGDEDRYKLDWTSAACERRRIQVFGRNGMGMARFAAWRYGRPAAKRVTGAVRQRSLAA